MLLDPVATPPGESPPMISTAPSPAQDELQLFRGGVRRGSFLEEVYRYGHVVRYQTYAGLKSEISRTYLGVAWWLLEPTMAAVTMYVVFGFLLSSAPPNQRPAGRADFFPFLLVGTFAWQWFHNSAMLAANSIILKSGVMQQVYLPKAIFPLVSILNGTWKFLCTFSVMTVALWLLGYLPGVTYIALPVIVLVQFAFNLSVGLPLSVWIPYFRDGTAVIGAVLGFVGMASGIFFRPSQVPARYAPLVNYNPLANLLTAYRTVLLDRQWPDWWALGRVALVAAVLLVLGAAMMRRFDLKLAKIAV